MITGPFMRLRSDQLSTALLPPLTPFSDRLHEKRLEAIPWAARDIKCEQVLEQKNLSREELYDEQSY